MYHVLNLFCTLFCSGKENLWPKQYLFCFLCFTSRWSRGPGDGVTKKRINQTRLLPRIFVFHCGNKNLTNPNRKGIKLGPPPPPPIGKNKTDPQRIKNILGESRARLFLCFVNPSPDGPAIEPE